MKATILMLFALVSSANSQDSIKLQRSYKVGDEDRYAVKLSAAVEVGDVDIQFKSRRKVKSVDSEGAAEIEFTTEELKTLINGQEASAGASPTPAPLVFKFDKYGRPVTIDNTSNLSSFMQFMGFLGGRPLKPGERMEINFNDQKTAARHATGYLVLDNVEKGEAKLVAHWEITTEATAKPMVVDMTSYVEVKTGTVLRSSGTIVPANAERAGTRALQFSMEILRRADGKA